MRNWCGICAPGANIPLVGMSSVFTRAERGIALNSEGLRTRARVSERKMKHKSKIWNGIIAGSFSALVASPALSVEIITKDDIVNNVVKKDQLVRLADNAILFLDTSSSTNDIYGDTGKPIVQAVKGELESRNSYFP